MYDNISLIAPYWTGNYLYSGIGNVRYTTYTTENGSSYIDQVNAFLDNTKNETFTATMILVAQWIDVCSIYDYLCFEVIHIVFISIQVHVYRVIRFKV